MIKYDKIHLIILITFILTISTDLIASSLKIKYLKNLSLTNRDLIKLRKDIRKTIYITKSRKAPDDIPELRVYKYKVKKGESFWKILAKTSQNIDTLMSINSLSSPYDIVPGRYIYIPNMRGVIFKNFRLEKVDKIAIKFKINTLYIQKINKICNIQKKYLFIPNARLTNLERSLFLGTGFASPIKRGRRTSGFGKRRDPFNRKIQFHSGIDLSCPQGTKIFASRSGRVSFAGVSGNYGLLVIIKHAHSYSSYYGHLSSIKTKKGAYVKRGNLIALSGNTGRSTGPHLHFEVRKKSRPVNPGILLR